MGSIFLTPTVQSVFNDFDRDGLLLGLERLTGEKNADYKKRLQDVFVHRAGAQYRNLIYGITRELGLELIDALNIVPVLDGNGDTIGPFPAIIFENTKCYIYSDYINNTLDTTLDRFEPDGGFFTLTELISGINNTGLFTATILNAVEGNNRSINLFNQSSIVQVINEDIASAGNRIHLQNQNLIPSSVLINSPNLNNKVANENSLANPGDYYLDTISGILYTYTPPSNSSVIRYKARNDNFIVEYSPVIIHKLNSDDFKTKMFKQTESGDNGAPTQLGADILNQLLSVFPYGYGK